MRLRPSPIRRCERASASPRLPVPASRCCRPTASAATAALVGTPAESARRLLHSTTAPRTPRRGRPVSVRIRARRRLHPRLARGPVPRRTLPDAPRPAASMPRLAPRNSDASGPPKRGPVAPGLQLEGATAPIAPDQAATCTRPTPTFSCDPRLPPSGARLPIGPGPIERRAVRCVCRPRKRFASGTAKSRRAATTSSARRDAISPVVDATPTYGQAARRCAGRRSGQWRLPDCPTVGAPGTMRAQMDPAPLLLSHADPDALPRWSRIVIAPYRVVTPRQGVADNRGRLPDQSHGNCPGHQPVELS